MGQTATAVTEFHHADDTNRPTSGKPNHVEHGNAEVWITPVEGQKGMYELHLLLRTDNTPYEPDFWEVTYCHYANCIAEGIRDYLNRYCPAPAEMLEAVRRLKLPAILRAAVK